MKSNVKLKKAIKGYFLTIESEIDGIKNVWAITEDELFALYLIVKSEIQNLSEKKI